MQFYIILAKDNSKGSSTLMYKFQFNIQFVDIPLTF